MKEMLQRILANITKMEQQFNTTYGIFMTVKREITYKESRDYFVHPMKYEQLNQLDSRCDELNEQLQALYGERDRLKYELEAHQAVAPFISGRIVGRFAAEVHQDTKRNPHHRNQQFQRSAADLKARTGKVAGQKKGGKKGNQKNGRKNKRAA